MMKSWIAGLIGVAGLGAYGYLKLKETDNKINSVVDNNIEPVIKNTVEAHVERYLTYNDSEKE